jgi:hypothetical protein
MEVKIGDKIYETWDFPELKKKSGTLSFKFYGDFTGPFSDIIIISKHHYQWVLQGCKFIKQEDIGDRFMQEKEKRTQLTFSYEKKSGSHIKEVVKSQVRDYLLDKVFKTD